MKMPNEEEDYWDRRFVLLLDADDAADDSYWVYVSWRRKPHESPGKVYANAPISVPKATFVAEEVSPPLRWLGQLGDSTPTTLCVYRLRRKTS